MLINFLGTSNFVHSLPLDQLANRERFPWLFQSHDYLPMVVGYYERFTKRSVGLTLLLFYGYIRASEGPLKVQQKYIRA
jgi:hypothetical protein